MELSERSELGKTGTTLGPIGISTSFGADQATYEEAYDRGCNYFTYGTFIKGRSTPFRSFMQEITRAGKREDIFVGLLSYSHSTLLGDRFLHSARKQLNTDYIDGLLLGYYSKRPPQRIIDWAQAAKEKGLINRIGLTTHNRKIVIPLAQEGWVDYFHIRYNAVHRGAESDIFPGIEKTGAGLVGFTATCWGKLMKNKYVPADMDPPAAAECYSFVLARKEICCCMMGVRNRKMLAENLTAMAEQHLSEKRIAELVRIGEKIYGKK